MQDRGATKQLMDEIEQLNRRVAELEAKQNQTEEALYKATQKYRDLFENAGDSILIVDVMTEQIMDANGNAARRLGYQRDELLNLTLTSLEVADPEAQTDQVSWVSKVSGTKFYECLYRHKNGTLIPVEVGSRMVTTEGRPIYQKFVRDITRRKQVQQEHKQLISELDAFAHTVAHDLKSPLGIVSGYAGLLRNILESYPDPEVERMLKAMEQGCYKMNNIINELLLLASMRQQSDVQIQAVDMRLVIADTLARLYLDITDHGAEITVLDEDHWPLALGYAPWIEEIWVNYIGNAIKYGGDTPRIALGAELVEGGMAKFWVRDTGIGLTPEQQAQLFKPFARIHDIRVQGHGLGLSIVQRIAQRLKGQVAVESVPGQGSTFSFTLPAAL